MLLIIVIFAALSLLVLGVLISQVRPTAFTQDSSRSLFAAEAGLQSALGQIRTATTGSSSGTYGDRAKLPCTVTGAVGDGATAPRYDVTLTYFDLDPTGHDAAWRTANTIPCSAGTAVVPAFALVRSVGTVATARPGAAPESRTLESKYSFRLTNPNIAGGLMYTLTQKACLEASGATTGASVKYTASARCTTENDRQRWLYDTDYAIKLATTTQDGSSGALCLTGASGAVTLQPCVKGRYDQLWSWESFARFRGQKADNSGYGTQCLWAGTTDDAAIDNKPLVAGTGGCEQVNAEWKSFSPTPAVGAGGAGVRTQQLVNYLEFGRCFDIPSENWDFAFLFISPCKQNPSKDNRPVLWNQRVRYAAATTAVGQPTTLLVTDDTRGGTTRCFTTPPPGASPAFVVLKACTGAANQSYTRFDDTGTYATSYLFTTSDGRCLSAGTPRTNNNFERSTIVAAPCTGGPEQKWNAPPDLGQASVTGTREVPRATS